jgi:6-phosphogluconolactonase
MVDTWIGDPPTLTARLGDELARLASEAAAAHRTVSVAVSGGSVATTFFPAWATTARIDWGRTDIFWADERAVAPTDPDSNYALARTLWLDPAGVPAARVHRMPADRPDLGAAAEAYADQLRLTLGPMPVLDLVLLGIGPDGHVASLFPGHALLGETARLVAAVTDSPKPPPRRLTLTPPVLTAARSVAIGAFGASKAAIVREALEDPASRLPAALIARAAGRAVWLLDRAAASQLSSR